MSKQRIWITRQARPLPIIQVFTLSYSNGPSQVAQSRLTSRLLNQGTNLKCGKMSYGFGEEV